MNIIEMDAGEVVPSGKTWVVTHPHKHKTLRNGDAVVMTVTPLPRLENLLLRLSDMTLHELRDEHEQYVHLREAQTPIIK